MAEDYSLAFPSRLFSHPGQGRCNQYVREVPGKHVIPFLLGYSAALFLRETRTGFQLRFLMN